jgi:hypothetical protein
MSGFQILAVLSSHKGVFCRFFGQKLELNFLSIFEEIFLQEVMKLFLGDPKTILCFN